MRRFRISGYFEAENIDDALARLAAHFDGIADNDDAETSTVLGVSEIIVEPDDAS